MSTTTPAVQAETGLNALMKSPNVMKRLEAILGKRASTFSTSVIQIANSNDLLKTADPVSILNCALVAATLDLPLNNQLGFAWIVPYKENKKGSDGKWTSRVVAQFQIGYRGFTQLALRTGQYEKINAVPVYSNQFKSFNRLTEELDADFSIDGQGDVIGYVAYFRLINGFSKVVFWSREKAMAHGKKYSKTFDKGTWNDDPDSMALKSVLKLTLGKWGIMSVEMQRAMITDQAVIQDIDSEVVEYPDNEPVEINKEEERVILALEASNSLAEIDNIASTVSPELLPLVESAINNRREEIVKEADK